MATDRFGNLIDPTVGYARGRHLASSADEVRRLRNGQRIAAEVVERRGAAAIAIFTGNLRHFPVASADLADLCEEWVGPGIFAEDLRRVAIGHLGGRPDDAVAALNRTSGGIVAAMLALSDGSAVVSFVPEGDRSHASVVRGCRLAGVELVECSDQRGLDAALDAHAPRLVVVTTVTSSLARLSDAASRGAIDSAHARGSLVFMDEAYGARLRPVLHDGSPSLELGGDLAITNTDKAGLSGPRAGVLVGREEPVVSVLAKASELGIEARAPIALGALRSLEAFDPEILRTEASDGADVADALEGTFGPLVVHRSDLGPSVGEEDVAEIVYGRTSESASVSGRPVPCEITAAIGMLLLQEHAVVTVNTHGQPGGRVSLRFKPTSGAVELIGADRLADAIEEAISRVAANLDDEVWMRSTLFGSS